MAFNFGIYSPAFEDAGFRLVLPTVMIALCISLLCGLTLYVLQSVGLYTIAKRRNIHHAWLSWIPIANQWILGSVADQYQYVVKNRVCNRRKTLLILNIVLAVLVTLQTAGSAYVTLQIVSADTLVMQMAGLGTILSVIAFLVFGVSAATAVFMYIAAYDLFTSCDPDTRVTFLVLSILFNFLLPIFLFADRRKDNGMPPRVEEFSGDLPSAETEFL